MLSYDIVLTGDRPTGALHIGHYLGSLKKRVSLQKTHKQFVMIADMQALTDNAKDPEKIREGVLDVLLDYLAVGIDPEKSTILLQSKVPALFELSCYYFNLISLSRVLRNPTVKTEISQKNFRQSPPLGFVAYPVSQAADITAFGATLVPVGDDQDPMIEQTNEVVRQVNKIALKEILPECRALHSAVRRLPGTDGKAKMGKSLENAIFLKDSEKATKEKVMGMFTDPGHIHVEDPGVVKGNPVFTYLGAFFPDKEKLEELKAHYRRGGLGDGVLKKLLFDCMIEELSPIREKRAQLENNKGDILEILKAGTEAANEVAEKTASIVREALSASPI